MNLALKVSGIKASVGAKDILKGLDLGIPFGEVHAIMGPNGSGKSTLCHVLTGKTGYTVEGSALLDGEEIMGLDVDERARRGLLQSFQYPTEIAGLPLREFLFEAALDHGISADEATARIEKEASRFEMDRLLDRALNTDLSGGEKKRSEIFQMAVLRPKVALMDEIDSGLDIDAVKQVSEAVEEMRSPQLGVVLITHYSRILRYLSPDRVHVMIDGRIVDSGKRELADELESGGYESVRTRLGIERLTAIPEPNAPSELLTETPFDI